MRAPTVEPNDEIRAARRHMEHTTFGNVRIHRKTSQIICRWPFGTPDDLSAQARHPCHCPNTDAIADEIYTSHTVNNLGEEFDFYFTTKQNCMPIRKEAHDKLQST